MLSQTKLQRSLKVFIAHVVSVKSFNTKKQTMY